MLSQKINYIRFQIGGPCGTNSDASGKFIYEQGLISLGFRGNRFT